MATERRRDVKRNSAFFLGAFGTALGVLGGAMSLLGILAWLIPDFADRAPDWFFALFVIGLMAAIVGAWPALDWLLNRRPLVGGPVLALFGVLLIAEGLVAVTCTAWDLTGWLALAGGVILLPAAHLAVAGGGTEPLEWRSLRSDAVPRAESRADGLVEALSGLGAVVSLVMTVLFAIVDGHLLTLLGLGAVSLGVLAWLAWRRFRG
ncbi:MAG: hypothetical protein IT306_14815 [Chloroflexi bacterium]|nr:hypothetical protein [Chloroflexota bacterium]